MVKEVSDNNYDLKGYDEACKYALWCVEKENDKVGKYVKKQCKEFLKIINGNYGDKYYVDMEQVDYISTLMTCINIMPKKDAYNNLVGFQWFFIFNSLCLRRKENKKRRYELSILLIARKNGRW